MNSMSILGKTHCNYCNSNPSAPVPKCCLYFCVHLSRSLSLPPCSSPMYLNVFLLPIQLCRRPNYDRVFSPPLSPAPKPSGIEVRFPMASPHTSPVPMCSTPTSPFRQASFQMSHAPVQSPPSSPLHVQTNSLLSLNSAFSPSSKSHSVGVFPELVCDCGCGPTNHGEALAGEEQQRGTTTRSPSHEERIATRTMDCGVQMSGELCKGRWALVLWARLPECFAPILTRG